MKKYYLHNGTEQHGPFDTEELKDKKISKDTPIWFEGIPEWTTAGKVDELSSLFIITTPPPFIENTIAPPPIQKPATTQTKALQQPIKKKSNAGRTIFITVGILVLVFGGLFVAYNMALGSSSNYGTSAESYQEKVMTIEEIERSQPTNFLTADGNYNETFWGDKIKVHGVIKSIATVAKYKDAVVRVTYYSKTKTVLGNNDYTIYDNFPPNSETKFELKIENYKNVNSIGWDVIEATSN